MSDYEATLREMSLDELGREIFVIAKRNAEDDQPKINAISTELRRRDEQPSLVINTTITSLTARE